jgi:hypothetical protein
MLIALVAALALQPPMSQPGRHVADSSRHQPVVAVFLWGPNLLPESECTGISPRVVLYDDGTVIYSAACSRLGPTYVVAMLTPAEREQFLHSLPLSSFARLDSLWYNNLPNISDQTIYTVWARQAHGSKCVHLYGTPDSTLVPDQAGGENHAAPAPGAFVRIFQLLYKFTPGPARPWKPERYELILSDSGVQPPTPDIGTWPAAWPTRQLPGTHRDPWGGYHVPLSADAWAAFLRAYPARYGSHLFAFAGVPWFTSVRYLFPAQQDWDECVNFRG